MKITVNHPTDRPNFYNVHVDQSILVWFSYETPIAFQIFDGSGKIVIRENSWNQTTGKHLNYVDSDKSNRIASADFEKQYEALNLKSF
jgi:hypothetical protein